MKPARILVVTVLAAGMALATLGGDAGARGATTVRVGDNFFSPNKRTVSPGTKVNFKWVGSRRHNVFKLSGPGGEFKSETTDHRGVNFKKKFGKGGKYKLICTIHDEMKLKLKVK